MMENRDEGPKRGPKKEAGSTRRDTEEDRTDIHPSALKHMVVSDRSGRPKFAGEINHATGSMEIHATTEELAEAGIETLNDAVNNLGTVSEVIREGRRRADANDGKISIGSTKAYRDSYDNIFSDN